MIQKIVFLLIFLVNPLCGMLSLSKDIAMAHIQRLLFLEDIGHLKQLSSGCNELYDAEQMFPIFNECLPYTCSKLVKNYYTCTKALIHFASKKNKQTDENDKQKFEYLWQFHKSVRDEHAAYVLGSYTFTIHDCMNIYKKYRSKNKICTHILNEGERWLSLGNADNARIIFSCGSMHLYDLLDIKYTKKKKPMYLDECLEYIFYHACGLNNTDIIQVICGDSVDAWFFEYIMKFATSHLILNLIGRGIMPINTFDQWGKSMLHYAAEFGLHDVIRIVLAEHDYVNSIDNDGMTLLHHATKNLKCNVVKVLLENEKINVSFVDTYGNTAFDYVKYYIFDNSIIKKRKKNIRILLRPYVEAAKSKKKLTHYKYQQLQ